MQPGPGTDGDRGSDEGHDDPHLQDWSRLGRLIKERRTDLGLTQGEVHSAGGPSSATLYLLETGRRGNSYRPQILRRLERALGWRGGSIGRVLDGGQPLLDGENEVITPDREDHVSRDSQAWQLSFRQLPMTPHSKLLILSQLLEEVIAELRTNTGRPDPIGSSDPRSGSATADGLLR